MEAGVDAIIAATRGEYKAEPRPAAGSGGGGNGWMIFLIIIVLILMFRGAAAAAGGTYGRRGYRRRRLHPHPHGLGRRRRRVAAAAAGSAEAEASRAEAAPSAAAAPRGAGRRMQTNAFLHALDNDRIVAAILDAESRSRGEIRVHVTNQAAADVEAAARAQFEKLDMTKTALRNGVLIYVAPAQPEVRGDRRRGHPRAVRSGLLDRTSRRRWRRTSAPGGSRTAS